MKPSPTALRTRAMGVIALVLCLLVLRWWSGPGAPEPTPDAAPPPSSTGSAVEAAPPAVALESESTSARAPGRDLSVDESRGGHTLDRHVGKSDAELADRLRREPNIAAASTYTDRPTAERVVAEALVEHASRIDAWRNRTGTRPNLALDYRGQSDRVIGRTLRRGADRAVDSTAAVVVLRWNDRRREAFVLTSYPEIRR